MEKFSYEIHLHQIQAFFWTHHTSTVDCISPMILQLVFQYLNSKDIRQCRLVSHLWKEVAQPSWDKKSLVIINSVTRMNRYTSEIHPHLVGAHPNFMIFATCPLMESTRRFFSLFGAHIKSLDIRKCLWMGRNFPLIIDLIPNLKSLTLIGSISPEDCVYPNIAKDDIKSIISTSKKLFWSKLTTLCLDLGGYAPYLHCQSDLGNIQPFIFQLLMAAPNLETLNFHSHDQYYPRMVFHTLLFRSELKLQKLSKIHVRPVREMSANEMHLLQMKAYPISNLSLDVVCAQIGLNALHGLLASLGGTLAKLRVKYILPEGVLCHFFPSARYLKELRSLTLINFRGNVGFAVDLKKLQYFTLDHTIPEMVFEGFSDGQVFKFPLMLRLAPLVKNKNNVWDRAIYLIR